MEMVGGNGRNEQQNETIINKPMGFGSNKTAIE